MSAPLIRRDNLGFYSRHVLHEIQPRLEVHYQKGGGDGICRHRIGSMNCCGLNVRNRPTVSRGDDMTIGFAFNRPIARPQPAGRDGALIYQHTRMWRGAALSQFGSLRYCHSPLPILRAIPP